MKIDFFHDWIYNHSFKYKIKLFSKFTKKSKLGVSILTTTIVAYPKPKYVKLPDWFDNLDTSTPTKGWEEAKEAMGDEANLIIKKGTQEAVRDQVNAGITILANY